MAEQIPFDFEASKVKPPEEKRFSEGPVFLGERIECTRCGNDFDSVGSCVECARNPKKIEFLKNLESQRQH